MSDIKNMQHAYPLEQWKHRLLRPLESLLGSASAGGVLLILTTVIALIIANSSWSDAFYQLRNTYIGFEVGQYWTLKQSIHHWVNDGLMALFFLLVGLELKREFLVGELSSLKEAMLPVAAALGGMIVPAVIYTIFNINQPTAAGWGIPMATDIAFAIGALLLLGKRIPHALLIFLMALAIVDDLGAVLVIALFYTSDLNIVALMWSLLIILILILFNRAGVRNSLPYMLVGVLLWYAMLRSGIHATLAGVILAMCIPARPAISAQAFNENFDHVQPNFDSQLPTHDDWMNQKIAALAHNIEATAVSVQSPLQRMEHALTPWITFLIVPIFALVNAGVDVRGLDWQTAFGQPVTLGIVLGLVLGKFVGISLFSWLAVFSGMARLPNRVGWQHIMGVAWLGGIGFTMSLFVSQLAFSESVLLVNEAKLGILSGSLLAAFIGISWLLVAIRKNATQ